MRALVATLPLLLLSLGCHPSASKDTPPSSSVSLAPPAASLAAPSSQPAARPQPAKPNTGTVYVGAVGGAPVRATLTVTPSHVEGHWVYEKTGSAEGLRLEGACQANHCDVTEYDANDRPTGSLHLAPGDLFPTGATFEGGWTKPNANGPGLPVGLSREERARVGENRVLARRIVHATITASVKSTIAVFVPVVEGPAAARLAPNLSKFVATRMDSAKSDEVDAWDGLVALDFDVPFADARVVTFDLASSWLGAYPSSARDQRSFSWATGEPIDRTSFRRDKHAGLVERIGSRVRAAWTQKRKELIAVGSKPGECDREVAESFFTEPPVVATDVLDRVAVRASGIAFDVDLSLPHAVLACSPAADLAFSWDEVRPFLEPRGPLGDR